MHLRTGWLKFIVGSQSSGYFALHPGIHSVIFLYCRSMRILWIVGWIAAAAGHAQCPVAAFAVPPASCLNESLYFSNSSVAATAYQWDFCAGDLASAPMGQVVASSQSLFRTRALRVVKSNGNWFGFAIDQNMFLVRLEFGQSLDSDPALVTVGNPQNAIQLAFDLVLWQEGSSWFALVANTSADNLLLLSFGPSIQSTPTVTNLGNPGGALKGPAGIQVLERNGSVFALVTNSNAPEVIRLAFGNSITNIPVPTIIPVPGAVSLRGISLTRECDHDFALVADNGRNQVYYLDFPSGVHDPPVTGMLMIPSSSISFPFGIAIRNEGGDYYALV